MKTPWAGALTVGIALALLLAMQGCAGTGGSARSDTILNTMKARGDLVVLGELIEMTELAGALRGPGPFTVFAPNDPAFARLSVDAMEDLVDSENRMRLSAVLTYHVAPGYATIEQLRGARGIRTLLGEMMPITALDDGTVRVDGATVIEPDIPCRNGIVHVTDRALVP